MNKIEINFLNIFFYDIKVKREVDFIIKTISKFTPR